MPGGIPYQLDLGCADGLEGEQRPTDAFDQALMHGTTLRCQRHLNSDSSVLSDDTIDQAEVDDVQPKLGIDDGSEDAIDLVGRRGVMAWFHGVVVVRRK